MTFLMPLTQAIIMQVTETRQRTEKACKRGRKVYKAFLNLKLTYDRFDIKDLGSYFKCMGEIKLLNNIKRLSSFKLNEF